MKTATDLQKLIDDIDDFWKEHSGGLKVFRNKDSRLRNFYYKVMLYLETNPRECFLKKQLDKTLDYIRIINERGTADLLKRIYPHLNYKQARNQWRKDNQVPHWRAQQKVLEFILN
jgi:hypothetical protein